jgi:hypothetical protein
MENNVQLPQRYQMDSVQCQTSTLLPGLPWSGHVNDVLTASDPFKFSGQIPNCCPSLRRSEHVNNVHLQHWRSFAAITNRYMESQTSSCGHNRPLAVPVKNKIPLIADIPSNEKNELPVRERTLDVSGNNAP